MRVIEKQMMQAIRQGKSWRLDNTEVRHIDVDGSRITLVYLHNNLIAEIGLTRITLWNRGYSTQTTKSRINAILSGIGSGLHVYQKSYVWHIDGTQWVDGMEYFIG